MKAIRQIQVSVSETGTAFGECGEGFLRISYAYSLEDLKVALGRLERFIEKLRNEDKASC